MKKIILSFVMITSLAYGQGTPGRTFFDSQIKTPGVTDFVKYGNLSSTSYTGELRLTIPIVSIPIPGQNNFNISADHIASGFRPSKRNGLIGQNWFLNMGGAITREINGMADDQKGSPQQNGGTAHYTNGTIVGVATKTHNAANVYNGVAGTSYTSAYMEQYLYANSTSNMSDPQNYESDPDIFSFNFNGISGKFYMGNDGQVKTITNEPEKLSVDLSQFAFQEIVNPTGCLPKVPSRIIITDSKGNKYYFGGETKNLEYTVNAPITQNPNARPVINAWYLYKIEYYTGYVLNFNYRDDSALTTSFADDDFVRHGDYYPAYSGNLPNKRDFLVLSEFYSDERSLYEVNGSFPGTGQTGGYSAASLRMSLQKIAILDNIEGEDFKIVFNYSRQNHKFNTRDNPSLPSSNGSFFNDFIDIKLDEISVRNKSNVVVKNFLFDYDYFGGSLHSRMFLKSIKESGKPPHLFEYYPTGTLPQPITFGIDHWGFWNGKAANSNPMIPNVNLQANGDFSYPGDSNSTSRNPSFTYALKGQISKITYPTGGYSTFEYEEHSYGKRLECRSVNDFVPQLYDVNDIAGGVRIKTISDFDGISSQNINIKNYTYVSSVGTAGSSGVLLKWPRYVSTWTSGNTRFSYLRSNPIGKNIMETPHITYSEVIETTPGNGSTRTRFTDFVSNPDINSSRFINANSWANGATPSGLAKNYAGYYLNDASIERGKPLWIKQYDNSNNLKQEISFEYNQSANRFNDYTARIHTTGPFIQFNKIYSYQDYVSKKTTKTFFQPNASIDIVEQMQYDPAHNHLISTTYTASESDIVENQYTYLTIPTENLVLKSRQKTLRNGVKLSEEEIQYGNSSNAATGFKYLPIKILSSKFPNSNPTSGGQTVLDLKFSFDKYDAKSNPVQVSENNGKSTVYLWGYNKTKIIAKIENATFPQVASALGISETQLLSYDESQSVSINALRQHINMQNSMITTYSYVPLVGLASIRDPKGTASTFIYDRINYTLRYVLDNDRNIINEYIHHYKN
ncbi:hypothetical protein [Flavobacterium sp. Leaf359]|uniref:hypothetical protein n=1 Tax=Flavobacterium sp. Leaf359 TaxID=1736351 RepID=UPI000A62F573|nr:hypothetical protein [Flavobacterium sp. Leaf359]